MDFPLKAFFHEKKSRQADFGFLEKSFKLNFNPAFIVIVVVFILSLLFVSSGTLKTFPWIYFPSQASRYLPRFLLFSLKQRKIRKLHTIFIGGGGGGRRNLNSLQEWSIHQIADVKVYLHSWEANFGRNNDAREQKLQAGVQCRASAEPKCDLMSPATREPKLEFFHKNFNEIFESGMNARILIKM